MKAAFVKTKGKVELRDLPMPTPGKGEVVLRIVACGVCGSDFIEARHWAKDWKRFGHELTGTVHALGEGGGAFDIRDKVALALSAPCGECEACGKGMPRYCSQMIVAEQGGFAEFLLVKDVRLLRKVSSSISDELSCLVEPLTVILDAFDLVRLNKDEDALFVAGGGFLGALSVLAAHLMGVPVSGLMARRESESVRRVLEASGGTFVKWPNVAGIALPPSTELRTALSRHVGRTVVLHTAPPRTISNYIEALPYGSEVVNIGLSGASAENQVKLDGASNVFKRVQLLNAFPVPCLTLDAAIELLERHAEAFTMLETQTISLETLPQFIKAPSRSAKTIVMMET